MNNLETIRIDLGDGDFALAIKPLLHKTSRQVQQYYKAFMKPRGKPVMLSEIQEGKANLLNDYEIDLNAADDDEVAQIFILNQVTELSFGAVNKETLDNMPATKYDLLVKELNGLYKPSPLAVSSSQSKPLSP